MLLKDLVHEHKRKLYLISLRFGIAFLVFLLIAIQVYLYNINSDNSDIKGVSTTATSSFSQTDWSGGAGQSNFSTANRFLSSSNTDFSSAGKLELDQEVTPTVSWYDSAWAYRKKITVDPTKVAGASNFTNYPLLISLNSDADLSSKAQSSANDILFTSSDGTKLNHEIERYDSGTGKLVAWVKVPTLDTTNNTEIYMYYGNALATDQQAVNATWNSNYKMVQHFHQISGPLADSTSNANDASSILVTNQGDAPAQIGGATYLVDGADKYITIPDSDGDLSYTQNFSFSIWVKADAITAGQQEIFVKGNSGPPRNYGLYLSTNQFMLSWYSGGWYDLTTTTLSLQADQWYYVTFTRDSTNSSIYVDGQLELQTDSAQAMETNTDPIQIGFGGSTYDFAGTVDELRVANVSPTADQIQTDYNNQSSPSTFYSVSSESSSTSQSYFSEGSLVSSIFDTTFQSDWGLLTANTTLPSNTTVSYKVRTGSVSDLSDASDFSLCDPITSGSDISSNNCVDDTDRYIQYQVTLGTTDSAVTPSLLDVAIEYSNTPTTPSPTATDSPTASASPTPSTVTASPTSTTTPSVTASTTVTSTPSTTASPTSTVVLTATEEPASEVTIFPTKVLTNSSVIVASGGQFEKNAVTLSGVASPNAVLQIKIAGLDFIGVTKSDDQGLWSYQVPFNVPVGDYSYQAREVLENGEYGEYSESASFKVKNNTASNIPDIWLYTFSGLILAAIIFIIYLEVRLRKDQEKINGFENARSLMDVLDKD